MKTYKLNSWMTLTEEQMKEIADAYNEPEFEYPIFKLCKNTGLIVKFVSLNCRIAVFSINENTDVGYVTDEWSNHTDKSIWEDLAYDKDGDLWDGQPVYCWDDDYKYSRIIMFYDAVNKCTHSVYGIRDGIVFDNCEAIPTDSYDDWMIEALKTLKR